MRRVARLYGSSVGKKVVMAVSGVILVGFIIGHMVGNLKAFQGSEHLDAYAEFLREVGYPAIPHGGFLWFFRIVLLVSVALHMLSALQLYLQSSSARSVAYRKRESLALSYASRTMRWGGVIIASFVVYHLLHFTTGTVHPRYVRGDVYANLVVGFQSVPVGLAYLVAVGALGLHLYHGIWSAFQTLGASHPKYDHLRRPLAVALAVLVVAGFLSVPAAVMAGIIS